MLVVKSKIAELVKSKGKRMSKDAWIALDNKIIQIINTACRRCNANKTITEIEILL